MKIVYVVCIKQNHMADFLKVFNYKNKAEEFVEEYKKKYPKYLKGNDIELVIYEEQLN